MLKNAISELINSFSYVINADYFWQAMAAVTITSMIMGTLVYNGDLDKLKRATLAIITYGLLIVATNATRIYSYTNFVFLDMHDGQALAGTTTTIIVTVFYVIGLYLGFFAHKLSFKNGGNNGK